MRISTDLIFRQAVDAIRLQQTDISQTQAQLVSGKRVLSAADDPLGVSSTFRLTQRIEALGQFQDTIDSARTRLAQSEDSLNSAVNIMQRVRELVITANGPAVGATERQAIAAEVRSGLTSLVAVANTQDPGGEYLYAGFNGGGVPFAQQADGTVTYAGDQGARAVQVGLDNRLQVSDSGFDVFFDLFNGNGRFQVQAASTNTGSGVIDTGSVVDEAAFDGVTRSVVIAADSGVNVGGFALSDSGTNDTLTYELRINNTVIDTLNEGDTRTLAALETAIDAASGTTGVEAHIDSGKLYLTNTPGSSGIVVNERLLGASEDTDTATGLFGNTLTGLSAASATSDFSASADSYVILNAGAVEGSGSYVSGTAIEFSGIRTRVTGVPATGDTFTVSASTKQSMFSTINKVVDALGESGAQVDNQLSQVTVDLDRALDKLGLVRAEIGGRLNTLDTQETLNTGLDVDLRVARSQVEDLDYTEAAGIYNRQLLGLQAAQQAFVKVQGLSLFNFI